MPFKDGFQTAKELSLFFFEHGITNTHVIALSGFHIVNSKDKFFDKAILKPIGIQTILDCLREFQLF